jgi:glucan phosphorylase
MITDDQRTIAYFSMEIGLDAGIPTYSGDLGILAGDTIRSAADLKVPKEFEKIPTGALGLYTYYERLA